jgi:hypothetical protein
VALLALVVSLGGASVAKQLITGEDIKNGSITAKDVKKKTLTGKQVKDGSLRPADLAKGTLPTDSLQRVAATAGADLATAMAAAPKIPLFSKGGLSVYAKCYTDSSEPRTYSTVFISSASNYALFDSDNTTFSGGPALSDFLGPTTPEDDRKLMVESAEANDASLFLTHSSDFHAISGDGKTIISGIIGVGAKNGTLAGGNGPWGAGDACLIHTSTFTSN